MDVKGASHAMPVPNTAARDRTEAVSRERKAATDSHNERKEAERAGGARRDEQRRHRVDIRA